MQRSIIMPQLIARRRYEDLINVGTLQKATVYPGLGPILMLNFEKDRNRDSKARLTH